MLTRGGLPGICISLGGVMNTYESVYLTIMGDPWVNLQLVTLAAISAGFCSDVGAAF